MRLAGSNRYSTHRSWLAVELIFIYKAVNITSIRSWCYMCWRYLSYIVHGPLSKIAPEHQNIIIRFSRKTKEKSRPSGLWKLVHSLLAVLSLCWTRGIHPASSFSPGAADTASRLASLAPTLLLDTPARKGQAIPIWPGNINIRFFVVTHYQISVCLVLLEKKPAQGLVFLPSPGLASFFLFHPQRYPFSSLLISPHNINQKIDILLETQT